MTLYYIMPTSTPVDIIKSYCKKIKIAHFYEVSQVHNAKNGSF